MLTLLPPSERPPPKLSPMQSKIYNALKRAGPSGLPTERLVNIMYADDVNGGPENYMATVYTTIYQANKRLKPARQRIRGTWGHYALEHL